MRKVAVVETGDREHPHEVERGGDRDRSPAPADPDHCEAAEVEENKRQAAAPLEVIGTVGDCFRSFGEVIRVKPLADSDGETMKERLAKRNSGRHDG